MADDRQHAPGSRPMPADGAPSPGEAGSTPSVHRHTVVEAEPGAVWRALTDPEALTAWWGEGSELDATPGGEGRFVEDGQPVRRARVVEVQDGRRLVLDWWPEDPDEDDPASRVTIELVPCPSGTAVEVDEAVLLDLSLPPVLVDPRNTALPPSGGSSLDGRALARV